MDAFADLLMTILLNYSIGPHTKPVHEPKQLYFENPLDLYLEIWQNGGNYSKLRVCP